MDSENDKVNRLFQAVDGGADLDHEGCLALLAVYVEAQRAGENAGNLYPQVVRHLDTCEACDAEYAALLDLAIAEERGLIPRRVGRPEVDAWFLPSHEMANYVQGFVKRLLGKLLPDIGELDWLSSLFLEGRPVLKESGLVVSPLSDAGTALALKVLAATYGTTQAIVDIGLAEGEDMPTVVERLRVLAKDEAVRQGLPQNLAADFAVQYAEIVSKDIAILRALSAK